MLHTAELCLWQLTSVTGRTHPPQPALIKSLSVSPLQPISMLEESLAQTQELVGKTFIFSVKLAVNVHIGHVAGSAFSKFPDIANLQFYLFDSMQSNQLAFPFISMVVAWLVLHGTPGGT